MTHKEEAPAKVLIVDDLPDNSRLLAHLARDQGYDASVASNGRRALEIALAERPDVILLDVMMPEMDGIEVCRRSKADEELQREMKRRIQTESDLRASEQRYRRLLGAVTTYTYSVERGCVDSLCKRLHPDLTTRPRGRARKDVRHATQ